MASYKEPIARTTDGRVDPRALGDLYPVPKTFAERMKDDEARKNLFIKRQPRFVRIQMALYVSIIVIATLIYAITIQSMWVAGSIGSVFLSFAIAIILAFLLLSCWKYVVRTFYQFNCTVALFVTVEIALISGAILALAVLQDFNQTHTMLNAGAIAFAHFALLYGVLLVFIRYEK